MRQLVCIVIQDSAPPQTQFSVQRKTRHIASPRLFVVSPLTVNRQSGWLAGAIKGWSKDKESKTDTGQGWRE